MARTYRRQGGTLRDISDASTLEPGRVTTPRFAGDPGRGKLLLGFNHVDGQSLAGMEAAGSNQTGLSIEAAEQAVFPTSAGFTTANRPKFGIVREYEQGFALGVGARNKILGWTNQQGRLVNMSIQAQVDSTTYDMPGIRRALDSLSGNPVKTTVNSMCDFIDGEMAGPLLLTLNHEPQSPGENPKVPMSQAEDQRVGSRLLMDYMRDRIGRSKLTFVGPHPVSNDYQTNKNWQQYHPEWINDSDGWTDEQYLDCDAWDPYIPRLAAGLPDTPWTAAKGGVKADGKKYFPADAVMPQWSTRRWLDYKNRVDQYAGYHHKPLVVGEMGLFSYDQTLFTNPGAVTMAQFFDDLESTCYETNTVGVCLWGNSFADYSSRNDPFGYKRAALRDICTRAGSNVRMAGWAGASWPAFTAPV